ncbi:MAG: sigma-70 family RNA polymerase sigma factor [Candidatus Omnitrophota bacterium]|nr:sigma-70 family RNA polymerase sigma factor [Candidatus Omnitrophota bacterium]
MHTPQLFTNLTMEAFKIYLKEIRHIPLLTPEQEKELSKRIKKGDEQARKEMIRSNLRLVIKIAKRYVYLGMPFLDLIEDGNLGLMRAVEKFDYRKGCRFSTYAVWWIKQSITRSIADQGKMIRVPVYINELIVKWKTKKEELTQKFRRAPTSKEIAKKLKLPKDKVEQLNFWMSSTTSSLEIPVSNEISENQVSDLIKDETTALPDDDLKHLLDKEKINDLLETMTPSEKEIINLRFGLKNSGIHTLAEIARKQGLSRERIRQIEEKTLEKLRTFVKQQQKEGREL